MQTKKACSIPEALLWTCSFQVAQAIVLVLFLVLLLTAGYGFSWPGEGERVALALDLNLDRSFLLIGVSTLGALLLVLPIVRVRLGKRYREIIGWRNPRHEEMIYALATVIPIAVLGDMLYEVSKGWWSNNLLRSFLGESFQASPLEFIQSSLDGVPYPILVVALALGPAFGEELIFRGIIGRGLVQRYGVYIGSLFTIVLFAAAHTSPAHALATLPIAILLQFLYLKTGTIWIPVFVHFCNNLLAVSMMRFKVVELPEIPTAMGLVFFFYLLLILLVYEFRKRAWDVA